MVLKQDPGDGKMKEISDYIYEMAFLKAEYRLLTSFYWCQYCLAGISFIVPTTHILIVVAFILEHFSALAGNRNENRNQNKC
jgi:K(+)-stimulated pyrophosphate-energized sodium pump